MTTEEISVNIDNGCISSKFYINGFIQYILFFGLASFNQHNYFEIIQIVACIKCLFFLLSIHLPSEKL